jgi:plasmid stabilization system protein ParE
MLNVRILPVVYEDFDDIERWYERQREKLGLEFAASYYDALGEIERVGHAVAENVLGFRAIRLRNFPCSVLYRVHDGIAYVTAISHAARDPKRLDNLLRRRSKLIP